MLTEEEIKDFFKDKTVEWSIIRTMKIKLKNGNQEHHVSYPETLEQLQAAFIKARDELLFAQGRMQRLNMPKDLSQQISEQPKEGCCHESKKTMGVGGMVAAIASGKIDEETMKSRLEKCSNCQIKDIEGERLYRIYKDVPYCGVPRLKDMDKIQRFERDYGCGCNLKQKTRYNASKCPLGIW